MRKQHLETSTFAHYRLFLLQNNDNCRFIIHIRHGQTYWCSNVGWVTNHKLTAIQQGIIPFHLLVEANGRGEMTRPSERIGVQRSVPSYPNATSTAEPLARSSYWRQCSTCRFKMVRPTISLQPGTWIALVTRKWCLISTA